MKPKLLSPLVVLSLLAFSAPSARSQTLVTFDDFDLAHNLNFATNIPDGYQGLSWSNFYVGNSILRYNSGYVDGYYYGMVSASNVAFDGSGFPAEIDAQGTNFNFLSAYLTGAWRSNLNIEVEGFNGATLLYSNTVVASATSPTLFTFNYMDIDRLYFNSFGGEDAFGSPSEANFVMDNVMFDFIPEPSTFLLAALGGVSLIAFLKCKRRGSGAERIQNHS